MQEGAAIAVQLQDMTATAVAIIPSKACDGVLQQAIEQTRCACDTCSSRLEDDEQPALRIERALRHLAFEHGHARPGACSQVVVQQCSTGFSRWQAALLEHADCPLPLLQVVAWAV